MGVLHYLDVFIGYAMAMAVLATIIGSVSAGWLATIRTQTRHLKSALATALGNLEHLDETASKLLAEDVLMSKLVKQRAPEHWLVDPMDWKDWKWTRWFMRLVRGVSGEAIHREELALIVLRLAADNNASALLAVGKKTPDEATALLRKVEQAILNEEVANPSLPAQIWRTNALAEHAPRLSAALFTHFDNLMDRVDDNTKATGKVASMFWASVFLCFYPVDSIQLIGRISADEGLRKQLVQAAIEADTAAVTDPQQKREIVEKRVAEAGLFTGLMNKPLPVRWPWDKDGAHWPIDLGSLQWSEVLKPGVWITWAMVSMGAPFWLGVLNRLLGLRSALAQRGEQQRSLRDQDLRRASVHP